MRETIVSDGDKKFLVITVPPNLDHGFVSRSKKSFVFRVMGTYLKSNGAIIGEENKLSGYISKRFRNQVEPRCTHEHHFNKQNIIKFDFDGLLLPVIKIPII